MALDYAENIVQLSVNLIALLMCLFRYISNKRNTWVYAIAFFLANLMIVVGFLLFPIGIANPLLYTFSSFIANAIYYLIVYKYLFGYSFWGTLWRCGFIYAASTLFAATGLCFMFDNGFVANNLTEAQMTQMKMFFAGSYLLLSVTVLTVGFVINYIVTRKFRRELKQSAIHSHS